MFVLTYCVCFTGVLVAETGIASMVATMSFQEDPAPSKFLMGVEGGVGSAAVRAVAFFNLASANFLRFSSNCAMRCSRL